MAKIVYNTCFGGFGLSEKAVMRYAELAGITLYVRKDSLCTMYATVPWEEYDRLAQENEYDKLNEVYFSVSDLERDDPYLV